MRNHMIVAGGLLALALTSSAVERVSAQGADKAAEVLAAARKAIGDKKLEALKTFSLEGTVERNVGERQLSSDVELLMAFPDKYLRSDSPRSGGMPVGMGTGFNGDEPIRRAAMAGMHGGGMVLRMGPGGPISPDEKPTPEQQEQINRMLLRSARHDASRLLLGLFAMAHPSLNVQYTYAGEAEAPDGRALVIDVKDADGFASRLFIDAETHLPLMLTYQGPQVRMITAGGPPMTTRQTTQAGGQQRPPSDEERAKLREQALQEMQKQPPAMVEYTLYFQDWRSADGIRFPHSIRRAMAGSTNEEWTVNKIKVNPKIDPKRFESES